ncbi:MAG: aminomethyltransferase beta-barrel domain-containing protein, partial [Gammaproteobacteria bacterium]
TPGQSIVFYHDEICIGGGVIESAIRHEQNYKANMQLQK